MDGFSVHPECQIVGILLRVDTTRILLVGGLLPPMRPAGETPEIDINPPLGAPLQIIPRGHVMMLFPQGDTSA